jgi:1-acyl-sn-glycerol-3-phosphate acyltransferase
MVPPRWLRRTVVAPLTVVMALVVLGSLPVWLLVAAALSPIVPGRLRPLRLLWVGAVYLAVEAVALVAMGAMWVASGFGWRVRGPMFQRAHYVLIAWLLRVLLRQVCWALRLRIEVTGADPGLIEPGRPLLVCCRHAGPGDSFILTHALINWYAREPRIVLKSTLQWDPAIDVLLNRLPSRFIAPRPVPAAGDDAPVGEADPLGVETGAAGTVAAEVGALAKNLDQNDAFVIFPEGGNFTPRRRVRAIARLRALGLDRLADRAERWQHVLAPRPGGLLAALDAAPEADVVWVAHTGLDRLRTIGDVWRELPMDKTLTMRWWPVPAAEVPVGRDGRVDWLYDWWNRIDDWIEANQPAERPI